MPATIPVTDSEVRLALHARVRALAGVCDGARSRDGVGFNGRDAPWGGRLAESEPDRWSLSCVGLVRKMLTTYQDALAAAGLPMSSVPLLQGENEALAEWQERKDKQKTMGKGQVVKFKGSWVRVIFPYDAEIVAQVKQVPYGSRQFDPAGKEWQIDTDNAIARALILKLSRHGFTVSQELLSSLSGEPRQAPFTLTPGEEAVYAASMATTTLFEPKNVKPGAFPFQRAGVEYVASHAKTPTGGYAAFIGDDLGLGKSLQSIMSICHLSAWPCIVICPASLKLNWAKEIALWCDAHPCLKEVELRYCLKMEKPCFYITNYDRLKKDSRLIQSVKWGGLIMDEFQKIKETRSIRGKLSVELFTQQQEIPVRLLLSGTAILNRPIELYNPLCVLGRFQELFGSWKTFTEEYCDSQRTKFGNNVSGSNNLTRLNKILRSRGCYLRREKKEVLTQLPPITEALVPLEITNRAEYDEAEANLIRWLKEKGVPSLDFMREIAQYDLNTQEIMLAEKREAMAASASMAEYLVRFTHLKRLCARGKMKAALEWIEEFLSDSDEKLVIFGHHRDIQMDIFNAVAKYNPAAIRGSGDMTHEEVEANKHRFQTDPACRVIVCSLMAGGVGHTLTAASNVAHMEYGWTPADMSQASSRLHRIGQKDAVNVWNLMAPGTIEDTILALIAEKTDVVNAVNIGTTVSAGDAKSLNILGDLIRKMAAKAEKE